MISPNVILMHVGAHAAIPSGYTRETDLNGKYLKGAPAETGGGNTGGNANHTHTSPNHTHTAVNSHTHTGNSATNTHQSGHSDADGSTTWEGSHYHTYSISTILATTVDTVAVTYSSIANDPPYYTVIFIKAGGYQAIPANAVLFLNDSVVPTGFTQYANLDNKYPKGAADEEDAGDSGGSTTNNHTITHTHSTTHSHGGQTNGATGGNTSGQTGSNNPKILNNSHTHYATLPTETITSEDNSSIGNQAETVEPLYKKLMAIQNTSGAARLPLPKMVAMFLGAYNAIPIGWKVCDGSKGTLDMCNYFVKCASTGAEIGNSGGSNTHIHAAQAHNHVIGSHTHTIANLPPSTQNWASSRGTTYHAAWDVTDNPAHDGSVTDAQTGSTTNANTTANESDNQPAYVETIFIEFAFGIGGAALMAIL